MENESLRLNEYIEEDVKKLRDIAFPVGSGLIRRLLVRYYPCAKLHPNPDDEFCDPAIGPSNRIIQKYTEKLRRADTDSLFDPIQIVRIYPKGYIFDRSSACRSMETRDLSFMVKLSTNPLKSV